MKRIFIILVFAAGAAILASCSKTTAPKTDYQVFTDLFNAAVTNFNHLSSYTLAENSYFNFEINGNFASSSLNSSTDVINSPYYANASITQTVSNQGSATAQILAVAETNQGIIYTDTNGYITKDTLSLSDFNTQMDNHQLDVTLAHIPDTITKVGDSQSFGDEIITYSFTFTLNDLPEASRDFLDQLFQFYIDSSFDHSEYPNLLTIGIQETIQIDATTSQFVKISYDINDLFKQAFKNVEPSYTLTNTEGLYYFQFSNLNNVNKDLSLETQYDNQ